MKFSWHSVLEYSISRIIPAIISFSVIPIYTRFFSPDEYGQYILILTIISVLVLFVTSQIRPMIVRFYAYFETRNELSNFFSMIIAIHLILSFIFSLLIVILNRIFIEQIPPAYLKYSILILLLFIFSSFFESFVHFFRGENKSKYFSLFWSLYILFRHAIAIILCLCLSPDLYYLFLGFFIGVSIIDLILIFKMLNRYSFDYHLIDFLRLKMLLKFSFPLFFASFAFWTLNYFDRFLIEHFRSSVELGLYGLGFSISEKGLKLIFSSLMLHAYPVISHTWEHKGVKETKRLLSKLSENYLLLTIPILWGLFLLSKDIIAIIAPPEYQESRYILPLIAYGFFMLGLSEYVLKGFELKKRTKHFVYISLISGVLNTSLNIFIIPRFGIIGAGIVFGFSTTFYLFLSIVLVKKFLSWGISFQILLKILILNILVFVIVVSIISMLGSPIIRIVVSATIGGIIYFILLKRFGLLQFS